MGQVIGDILPQAMGIALSPIPIMALVIFLTAPGGKMKALAFALGAFAALLVLSIVVTELGARQDVDDSDSGASTIASLIQLGIGALFIALAYKSWKGKPKKGETPELPKWMQALGEFSLAKVFGLGALVMGINPKNLGILIGASVTIAKAGLTGSDKWITILIFVLLCLISFIIPLVIAFAMGSRADPMLKEAQEFLAEYNWVIMLVLFLVLGAKVGGAGIAGLFD